MNELKLEKKLMDKAYSLRNDIDHQKLSYEKSQEIRKKQNEEYQKYRLLKGIILAREKIKWKI